MDGFVNDTAKLLWLNIKYAKKEEALGLFMLFSAVQHPEMMHHLLPFYNLEEEFDKEF